MNYSGSPILRCGCRTLGKMKRNYLNIKYKPKEEGMEVKIYGNKEE